MTGKIGDGSMAKESRAAISLLIFIIIVHIGYLLPQSSKSIEVRQNYAPTVCPDGVSGARATALLPSKSLTTRPLEKPNYKFIKSSSGSLTLNRGAIIVTGDLRNSVGLQTRAGKWTTATTCAVGKKTTWFVGGTSSVTSRGKLVLLNSGLSDASVSVTAYSENGPLPSVTYSVKPASEKNINLDTLDPGAKRLAIKVDVLSGRITPFLLDERVKGLNNLGGDFVNALTMPSETLYIAGISPSFGKNSKVAHTLRLMTTAKVDASVSVEIISPTGVYVPIELSEIALNSQEVKDVSLTGIDFGKKTFALKITSTAPIVASVRTEVKTGRVSDFMWITPSEIFGELKYNLYGLEPKITFVGERVLVDVEWKDSRGKTYKKRLSGQSILTWKTPANMRAMTITNRTPARGGMSWMTADGVAYLPLVQGSQIESATRPYIDIAVIQPRG